MGVGVLRVGVSTMTPSPTATRSSHRGCQPGTARRVSGREIHYGVGNIALGSDQFTYTIVDARGATASATVTVTWRSGLGGTDFALSTWHNWTLPLSLQANIDPKHWFFQLATTTTGSVSYPTMQEVEWSLPSNTVAVGWTRPGHPGGYVSVNDIVAAPHCRITYAGNRPKKYTVRTRATEFNPNHSYNMGFTVVVTQSGGNCSRPRRLDPGSSPKTSRHTPG